MDDTKDQGSYRPAGASPEAGFSTDPGARAGFCQECGRALTLASQRRIGHGIFCEPCASLAQPDARWQQNGSAAGFPGATLPGGLPPKGGDGPSPLLAGFLGLIPGVGAMFNAQYAKGAMHLIVFVILVALADNLNWVLWWLVWGWIFYQAFDAFHTAQARRDHLPLPNPFGWNDLGERLGFARVREAPPVVPFPAEPTRASHAAASSVAYMPPWKPAEAPFPPVTSAAADNPYAVPYAPPPPMAVPSAPPPASVPYTPIFTGTAPGAPVSPPGVVPGTRRFPIGAFWLIGLGFLFLMGNLSPEWHLTGRWFVPLLLAASAVWTALRRWDLFHHARLLPGAHSSLAGAMVGPAILLSVSVLLGLQSGNILPLRRSWPVLLVVWGMMLILQRSAQTALPPMPANLADPAQTPPQAPVRSTSGTGSLGL